MHSVKKNTVDSIPYYVGFDMGTASLGFAVTDRQYQVVRKKGRHLWGIRLFQEAQTAEETRSFRTARRRLRRSRERVQFLQEVFSEPLKSIDPGFLQRLNDSFFYPDDKQIEQKYSLFNDPKFTDFDYYRRYPTIYHLRKELIEDSSPHDIRLVYLALLHIMKNRGHFLFTGATFDLNKSLDSIFNSFQELLADMFFEEDLQISFEPFEDILRLTGISRRDRSRLLQDLLIESSLPRKYASEISKLLAGMNSNLSKLFDNEEQVEDGTLKCDFSKNYETERDNLESQLNEVQLDFLDTSYELFNWMRLTSILKDNPSLSHAKVESYEKHKSDLRRLKKLARLCDKHAESQTMPSSNLPIYRHIFVISEKGLNNYVAYSGHLQKRGKKQIVNHRNREQSDFLKFLKDIFAKFEVIPEVKSLLEEIDKGDFLPLQVGKDNSTVPHQIIRSELEQILENASDYLSFLDKETCEKLSQVFAFRIPYYVGPLNDAHGIDKSDGKYAWVKRKEQGRVYPWNFSEKIDIEKSAERFIERMTRDCSYLHGEKALPKQSLLYAEFLLLNSVNAIEIDNQRLDLNTRDRLIQDLFKDPQAPRRVTRKRIVDWFISNGYEITSANISGIDLDIPVYLEALHDYKKLDSPSIDLDDMEEIIKTITLFPDDTKMIKTHLSAFLTKDVSAGDLDFLSRRRYKDWGRLSRKFLAELKGNGERDYGKSIIQMMRENTLLLMELLSDKYTFTGQVNAFRQKTQLDASTISYEVLDDYMISPSVRRMIWQTLQVFQDIQKVMGGPPEKIFIEFARSEEAKKERTVSRKENLIKLYENCRIDSNSWLRELHHKLKNEDERNLFSKKLFLYYMQCGRCAYSGEIINIEDLHSEHLDIDHIYPRSLTKDDSIHNNLVLVKSLLNRQKGDDYPLPHDFQEVGYPLWKQLRQQGFMGVEKFSRLTRKSSLSDEELAGFINRQLVETRQGTKVVADILSRIAGDTSRVVYVKAGHVNDFRYKEFRSEDLSKNPAGEELRFTKARGIINDIHHAKDAYLNIVVGNVLDEKFTQNPINFIRSTRRNMGSSKPNYSFQRLYNYDVVSSDSDGNERVVWQSGPLGTIKTVKAVMNRNDVLYTEKTQYTTSGIFNMQPVKAQTIDPIRPIGKVPLKGGTKIINEALSAVGSNKPIQNHPLSKMARYGAYNKESVAFSTLVDYYRKDGKRFRAILPVPIGLWLISKKQVNGASALLQAYFKILCEATNLEVIIPQIPMNSVFEINGYRCRIRGKTGDKYRFESHIQAAVDETHLAQLERVQRYYSSIDHRKLQKINSDERMTITSRIGEELHDIDMYSLAKFLVDRLSNGPWRHSSQLTSISTNLIQNLERIEDMDSIQQCSAILRIASTMTRAQNFDLSIFGMSKGAGSRDFLLKRDISKGVLDPTFFLIHQSPTGFHESKTVLW